MAPVPPAADTSAASDHADLLGYLRSTGALQGLTGGNAQPAYADGGTVYPMADGGGANFWNTDAAPTQQAGAPYAAPGQVGQTTTPGYGEPGQYQPVMTGGSGPFDQHSIQNEWVGGDPGTGARNALANTGYQGFAAQGLPNTGYQATQAGNTQIDPRFMAQLNAQAAGQGPSAAQTQLNAAQGNALNQAAALASSQRGNQNPGMAQRAALQAQSQLASQGAGQAAALRAQEQQTATGQLAGLTGQQASLNQQTALTNAGAQNQAAQFGAGQALNQNQFLNQLGFNNQANQNTALLHLNDLANGNNQLMVNGLLGAGTAAAGGVANAIPSGGGGNGGGGGQPVNNPNIPDDVTQAEGGVNYGPTKAIVGEQGPEEIHDGDAAYEVTKPTEVTLGTHGPATVSPLSKAPGGPVQISPSKFWEAMRAHSALAAPVAPAPAQGSFHSELIQLLAKHGKV